LIGQHNAVDWIEHYSAGREYQARYQAEEFLERVPEMVSEMRDCDLILYQAGADPHVNDPLGGFLTTEELQLRDRLVFSMAKKLGIPIAWNLAGGYQEDGQGGIHPVLSIHDNTMRECASIYLG
jgi:acetoin utilization deacetylase AcuC-like enzyme